MQGRSRTRIGAGMRERVSAQGSLQRTGLRQGAGQRRAVRPTSMPCSRSASEQDVLGNNPAVHHVEREPGQ